ncbi:Membrane-bound lytic murein transglycosylase B precursor (EC [Olavius sp. associated proteobacterium Delta 1]|nr:Membrane-bound lytic murein transglycosylase B precursor (EC [Olavius sp. associated proteobacterium Delta 1]
MSLRFSTNSKIPTIIIYIIIILLWSGSSWAVKKNNKHYFEPLQKKLIQDGFDSEKIKSLYDRPQVHFEADGVTVLFTYSESKVNYDQFSNDWSIRKAKKYMAKHQDDLVRTEKAFGVDKNVITAILLVESSLGKTLGTRSALNTLSTLASLMYPEARSEFYTMIPKAKKTSRKKYEKSAKRKSKWAYGELKALLEYADQEGFDPAGMPGSFAGAMGLAQFMPTSILAYGKDGNKDGTVDLLTHADAMASIANYLKRHGWRPGISRKKAEKVIYHYNHSEYYVKAILQIAKRLGS